MRNVFFPFDIESDTPIDVANEMVKELEIMDWRPSEIANMIDGEISGLVPDWKAENPQSSHLHVLNYQEDDYDHHNLFSPSSSSQVSTLGLVASHRTDAKPHWLQGIFYRDMINSLIHKLRIGLKYTKFCPVLVLHATFRFCSQMQRLFYIVCFFPPDSTL